MPIGDRDPLGTSAAEALGEGLLRGLGTGSVLQEQAERFETQRRARRKARDLGLPLERLGFGPGSEELELQDIKDIAPLVSALGGIERSRISRALDSARTTDKKYLDLAFRRLSDLDSNNVRSGGEPMDTFEFDIRVLEMASDLQRIAERTPMLRPSTPKPLEAPFLPGKAPASTFRTPEEVREAFKAGRITREKAKSLIRQLGGP